VRTRHRTGTQVQRRTVDGLDFQRSESRHRADHIDNGIHRADFVEMDRFDRPAVHPGLRLGQPLKYGGAFLLDRGLQIALLQNLEDIGQAAMVVPVVLLVDLHNGLTAAQPHLLHLADIQTVMGKVQLIQFRCQPLQGQTGIQHGPQNHIPAGAGKTIKIGNFHL